MELQFEQPDIRQAWAILVRRRWVVYVVLLASVIVALLGTFLATPLYRGTVTLQLNRQSPDILTFRDLATVDYSYAAYDDFYETQYKIMASEAVARRAVERMGLVSHPSFSVGDAEPGLVARLKSYLPKKGVLVEVDPVDGAATILRDRLEVSPVRNSQLVRISWISPEPELAANVTNAVADAYVQLNMALEYSTTGHATEFLVNQIQSLKREIAAIEERLQTYGESKGIVSMDQSSNVTMQALKDIATEWTAAQTRFASAKARYEAVSNSKPEALLEVMNSSLIARLRQEYASYEILHTQKSNSFKEDWPELRTLAARLEQARSRLDLETERIAQQVRASARTEYERAENAVTNLEGLLHSHESAAQRLKRDSVEYFNLQSEVQKKRETLDALLQRRNEMTLSTRLLDLDAKSSNVRIMERARPPAAPFEPSLKFNLALGMILGLSFGVGMAFLIDYLDNTIGSVSQLKKIVEIPVLAVIPTHQQDAAAVARTPRRRGASEHPSIDLVAYREPRTGTAEAYRELRTSLLLSHPGQQPRRIMTTSATPEEGKTATSVNLAVVLAQLGRRVLLIDTDLRRPRLHKVFKVANREGITTYLSGLEEHPGSLIRATGIENLDFLSSGPIPPNPSELLNSAVFAGLDDVLQRLGYDHVLFDSPPTLSVSDPLIIAQTMEVAILVVRAGRTPRALVRLAAEKLATAAAGSLGVVLNNASLDLHGSGSYKYQSVYGEPEEAQQEGPSAERANGAGA
jgi:succinoglycan biosynthesis transport protein ExoP